MKCSTGNWLSRKKEAIPMYLIGISKRNIPQIHATQKKEEAIK
jgi:hypothetical protein